LAQTTRGGGAAAHGNLFLWNERWAPVGHDGVADVLVDDPVSGRDLAGEYREVGIQEAHELLVRDSLAQDRERAEAKTSVNVLNEGGGPPDLVAVVNPDRRVEIAVFDRLRTENDRPDRLD